MSGNLFRRKVFTLLYEKTYDSFLYVRSVVFLCYCSHSVQALVAYDLSGGSVLNVVAPVPLLNFYTTVPIK